MTFRNLLSAMSRQGKLQPFDWSAVELLIMRIGYAVLAVWMFYTWWNADRLGMWVHQPHPVGLAKFIDLSWIGQHAASIQPAAIIVVAVGMVFYILGWGSGLAMLPLGICSVLFGALMNSQGATNHATQLVTMCGLAQCLAYLLPTSAVDQGTLLKPTLNRHRRAIFWASITLAAGYVVWGAIKLIRSDFSWLQDAQNLSVQLMKTHWAQYFDRLQPVDPFYTETAPQFIVGHPILSGVFFGIGLALELFAFLALINRRWAFFFGVTLLVLHVTIGWLFGLFFYTHKAILLILWINLPGLPKVFRSEPRLECNQDRVKGVQIAG